MSEQRTTSDEQGRTDGSRFVIRWFMLLSPLSPISKQAKKQLTLHLEQLLGTSQSPSRCNGDCEHRSFATHNISSPWRIYWVARQRLVTSRGGALSLSLHTPLPSTKGLVWRAEVAPGLSQWFWRQKGVSICLRSNVSSDCRAGIVR